MEMGFVWMHPTLLWELSKWRWVLFGCIPLCFESCLNGDGFCLDASHFALRAVQIETIQQHTQWVLFGHLPLCVESCLSGDQPRWCWWPPSNTLSGFCLDTSHSLWRAKRRPASLMLVTTQQHTRWVLFGHLPLCVESCLNWDQPHGCWSPPAAHCQWVLFGYFSLCMESCLNRDQPRWWLQPPATHGERWKAKWKPAWLMLVTIQRMAWRWVLFVLCRLNITLICHGVNLPVVGRIDASDLAHCLSTEGSALSSNPHLFPHKTFMCYCFSWWHSGFCTELLTSFPDKFSIWPPRGSVDWCSNQMSQI